MNLDLFKRKHKHDLPTFQDINLPIEYGFTAAGKDYYRFVDPFNLPPVRGLKAVTFYEEARMRCSIEYLQRHTEAMEAILTDPAKIDIFKIKQLNDQLKERIMWKMPEVELMYKLASVVYFDKSEHPANYDFVYNEKKIAGWKQEGSAFDFFMQEPLRILMPFMSEPEESLQKYSLMLQEVNAIHLGNISSLLSTPLSKTS
jgi:hypothetical protein